MIKYRISEHILEEDDSIRAAERVIDFAHSKVDKEQDLLGGPLPLFPSPKTPKPYPIDALGPILAPAAKAIASKVQVPNSMAAQSVLAAGSLVACRLADVRLPHGQSCPLSLFAITIAISGSRKTSADKEATKSIHEYEHELHKKHEADVKEWNIANAAWSAEKRKIEHPI
jgi:Protein of unknown function (DUF3987)